MYVINLVEEIRGYVVKEVKYWTFIWTIPDKAVQRIFFAFSWDVSLSLVIRSFVFPG